jgi:hypothetical protein
LLKRQFPASLFVAEAGHVGCLAHVFSLAAKDLVRAVGTEEELMAVDLVDLTDEDRIAILEQEALDLEAVAPEGVVGHVSLRSLAKKVIALLVPGLQQSLIV